jgi:uncharacterized protein involved in exopolysaccharide biosynthesis
MALIADHDHHRRDPLALELARAEPAPAPAAPWFLDPREVWYVLGLRYATVLVPLCLVVGLAVAALLMLPAQYTATAQILIDPHGVQVTKDDLNPPSQTSDASLLQVDSEMLVLSSDDVLRKVVKRFDLAQDRQFAGGTTLVSRALDGVAGLFGLAHAPGDPELAALRSLRERVSVQRLERSFVLSLSVTTDSRELSPRLAQAIADAYIEVEAQSRATVAREAGDALSSRLGELQSALRDAEDRAQAFKTANNLVGTRTQLVSEQQLGQLGDQLGAARARASEQSTRLNEIEAARKVGLPLDTLPEVLQSPTVSALKAQLAQAERVVVDISGTFGARHPSLVAAKAQVWAARQQIDTEAKRIVAGLQNQYKATAADVASLSRSMGDNKTTAIEVSDAMVRLRELDRQIDARRGVYETALTRARQLQEQQQVGASATRVISPATPPARRKGLSAAALLASAVAIGLALGVAAALLAEGAAGRVRTVRRLRQRLGLAVAGAIPPTGSGAAAETRQDLALGRLNTSLESLAAPGRVRVTVVTAADAVSRKSVLSLQLAALAAAEHGRALLVDADPDGSMMADMHLQVIAAPTRLGDVRSAESERRLVDFPGLSFLSAGRDAPRFDPRVTADRILDEAGGRDAVVVNAGTLGADLFTDRLVNDPRVSLVVLAVSGERSAFPTIERALPATARGRSPVCVLLDASPLDA